jgi:hypothetical protein
MNNNITKTDDFGLFDSIRHLDDEGNEYWFARELMVVLGYTQWRRFKGAINRTTVCLENIGAVKGANVRVLPGLAGGRIKTGEDYKLSRLACYLVAVNGDPRKPKIAAAQAYFVTKAREAEIFNSQVQIEEESVIEPSEHVLFCEQNQKESIFGLTMFQLECLHLHALMMELKMPTHERLLQYIDPIYHDMPLDAVKSQQWYRQFSQKQHLLEPLIEYKKVKYTQAENYNIEKEIERMKLEVQDERESYMYACSQENKAAARFSSKVTRRFTMRRTKALKAAATNYSGLF